VALEEIAEMENLSRFQGFYHEPESPSIVDEKKGFGHLVFVFMLLCGLMVVWLYSSISKPFDMASLNGIIQKSGVQAILANLAQLGIIVAIGDNSAGRPGGRSLDSAQKTRLKLTSLFYLTRSSNPSQKAHGLEDECS
jgi:hypothetical protein